MGQLDSIKGNGSSILMDIVNMKEAAFKSILG
jgi:hypothetical protein